MVEDNDWKEAIGRNTDIKYIALKISVYMVINNNKCGTILVVLFSCNEPNIIPFLPTHHFPDLGTL